MRWNKLKYTAIKGTRDILPEEMRAWQFIEETSRKVLCLYGFQELRTPLFEATDLYVRSIGQETDIVKKEMYSFKDMGGRDITLRPEGTAGVIRAAVENGLLESECRTKLFYMGPMFRQERPQKGRQREFYQIGAEYLGIRGKIIDENADFEIINVSLEIINAVDASEKKQLKDKIKLCINNIGCPACRIRYLDKLGEYFKDKYSSMCPDCQRRINTNILRVLDCKDEKDRKIIEKAPVIVDFICENCRKAYNGLKERLSKIKYYEDPFMVRGLDYYTGNVFEIKYEGLGAQNTILAGGRYDNLVKELGGPELSGVGFSLGMERLYITCMSENVLPRSPYLDVLFVFLGEKAFKEKEGLLSETRGNGIKADRLSEAMPLKTQLKKADKMGCRYAVIIGDDEINKEKAIVRNLSKSLQEEVDFNNLTAHLKKIL